MVKAKRFCSRVRGRDVVRRERNERRKRELTFCSSVSTEEVRAVSLSTDVPSVPSRVYVES